MKIKTDNLKKILQQFKYDVSDCGVRVFSRKNPNTIPKVDHPINIVRFNVAYRADSIMWHIEILINQRKAIASDLEKNFPECVKNPMPIIYSRKHQYYIFDDIIFNIISMFDYLASMIGFMYQNKYLKWNNLVNSAFQSSNEIGKSSVAQLIIKEHKRWVDALMGYRSDLIHRQAVFGDAEINILFEQKNGLNKMLSLNVPEKMSKIINLVSSTNSNEKLDIIDSSIIIAKEAYISGSNILNGIQ